MHTLNLLNVSILCQTLSSFSSKRDKKILKNNVFVLSLIGKDD